MPEQPWWELGHQFILGLHAFTLSQTPEVKVLPSPEEFIIGLRCGAGATQAQIRLRFIRRRSRWQYAAPQFKTETETWTLSNSACIHTITTGYNENIILTLYLILFFAKYSQSK